VGNYRKWCQATGQAFDPATFELRETVEVEVKWGVHQAGERRPAGWAPAGDCTSLSVLIRGQFTLLFRHPAEPLQTAAVTLQREGDYAIWRAGLEHDWQALEDSVILTVRWPAA
jgi:hypothetical protein